MACPKSHSKAGEQSQTLFCLSCICHPLGFLVQGLLPVSLTMVPKVLGESLTFGASVSLSVNSEPL